RLRAWARPRLRSRARVSTGAALDLVSRVAGGGALRHPPRSPPQYRPQNRGGARAPGRPPVTRKPLGEILPPPWPPGRSALVRRIVRRGARRRALGCERPLDTPHGGRVSVGLGPGVTWESRRRRRRWSR